MIKNEILDDFKGFRLFLNRYNTYIRMKSLYYSKLFLLLIFSLSLNSTKANNNQRLISDTLDVLHYGIYLDVLDMSAQTISGFTDITITSKFENTDLISLELLQLDVDSIFIDGILQSNWIHHDPLLEIFLAETIGTDDIIMIRIYYHGVPFHDGWGGFYHSGNYAFNLGVGIDTDPHNLGKSWFPCIDDFHDRASYDYLITVTEEKMAVCGGELISNVNNGDGTITYHWHMENTIPTYLASVAIGNYELVEDTYIGLKRDIPLTYYVRPSEVLSVAGSFIHMHQIMNCFETHFGPYDWNRVGYVSTQKGAMEHATNIAYPYGHINGSTSSEWLYAHELSHMWFGDKVTCASAEDMWINEGWAVYCESVFLDDVYGPGSSLENINDLHASNLHYLHTPNGDGQYFALYGIPTDFTYGRTVYDKGGTVVHTLRGYLGDSLFFSGVKGFLEEFAFDYMSSEDMRDFLSGYIGIDMTGFFDTWVFSPGYPHYSIDSFNVIPSGDEYAVTVYAKQKLKGTTHYANSNRVNIEFLNNELESQKQMLLFDGISGSAEFMVPFEPTIIFVDPDDLLCDATTDETHSINSTGETVFSNTFFSLETEEIGTEALVRVTHNWVPPDSLKKPVNGLRLSDYRYWTIDGFFPEDFVARGSFQYKKNNYLDNTLITNASDSLVILYRTGPSEDWTSIDFTRQGPWAFGFIQVDNLPKGEYTLAIWDHTVSTGDLNIPQKSPMKLFPNPSEDIFTFEFDLNKTARVNIFDTEGKLIDEFKVSAGQESIQWKPKSNNNGIFYVQLLSNDQKLLASDKIILIK